MIALDMGRFVCIDPSSSSSGKGCYRKNKTKTELKLAGVCYLGTSTLTSVG